MAFNWKKVTLATTAIGQTKSTSFSVEPWAIFYMALFPAMDDGDIGIEVSIDGGSNFYSVMDPVDGAPAVLVASGSDPGWIDFSDWVRAFGDNDNYLMRFNFAAQDPVIEIIVLMRG